MEWTKRNTIRLIELYEKETCLWDVMSAEHKNSQTRLDAFHSIAKVLELDVANIEKKITNIRSQYFRELAKVKKTKSGSAIEGVYKPTWYGFEMLSFLSPAVEPTEHRSTMNILNENTEEDYETDNDLYSEGQETAIQAMEVNSPHEPQALQSSKKTPRKRAATANISSLADHVHDAYKVMKTVADNNMKKDIFSSYGEYIAQSLRNLNNAPLQSWARHEINNIIYKAEVANSKVQAPVISPTYSHNPLPTFSSPHTSSASFPNSNPPTPLSYSNVNSDICDSNM